MNCDTCAERRKQAEPVPYVVHESDMARLERTNTRQFVIIIVLIFIIVVLGYSYVHAITAYETQEATVEVDTGEGDAFVSGIGDVYYGESQSKGENP